MLQMFLQQFVPAMEQVLTLAVPLGILFAILRRLPLEKYRRNYNTAIHWGFWLSVAIVAARVGTRNAVSREVAEAGAIAIAMVAEIVLIAVLVRGAGQKEKLSRPLQVAACAIGALLFFYHGMEIWLIPVGTVISAAGDYMTQAVAVKLAGFAAGLFFGIVSSYVTYKAAAALNPKRLLFVFIIQAAAMFIQQGIFLVQVLMARHILDSAALLSLMAPIIDHSSWLIFIIFFALLFVPLTLFSQKKPARPADANPAQYRRMLMQAMHKRRWGTATVLFLAGMVFLSSFGASYANRKEELVPAVPVTASGGFVDVDLSAVNDGHLHRFVYQTASGQMVRYIVILKGGNSYGVGLDACEICGPTGYYEKDGQVICRLCDVMMNKATIGLPGGCNPIPVEYRVAGGAVQISADTLEAAQVHFR